MHAQCHSAGAKVTAITGNMLSPQPPGSLSCKKGKTVRKMLMTS